MSPPTYLTCLFPYSLDNKQVQKSFSFAFIFLLYHK